MSQHAELASSSPYIRGDRRRGIELRTSCLLACVVLFSAALGRYWVSYSPGDSVFHGPEIFRLAHNLYDTGKFANPFGALATGPSAHLSPVLPSFIALLMKVYGKGSIGIYAIRLAGVLVLALQLALYPVFSRMLGMGEINGFIAASIWIVAKPRIALGFEGFYVAILLAVACCCYRRYLGEEGEGRSRLAWPLGSLMGLVILTSETVAPIYATWLAWEVWRHKFGLLQEVSSPAGSAASRDYCSLDDPKLFGLPLFHLNT